MDANRRSFLAATALLGIGVVAALWLLLGPLWNRNALPPASEPPPTEAQTIAAPLTAAEASATASPAVADAPEERTEQRREAPVVAPKNATLRGRCVDGNGQPLANCKVRLSAWTANSERMEAWLADHGEKPAWKDPAEVVTGADGTFAFTFWPPPPFQFALDVTRDGSGAMSGRWSTLAEGSDTDVGDVALTRGVRVSGRVVDANGVPQAKVYVTLSRRRGGGASTLVAPRWGDQARSAADGTFTMHGWLAPGEYEVRTQKRELESPKKLTLSADRPVEDVTVVVTKPPPDVTITGRVLDETGAPAAGVSIEDRSAQGHVSATSGRDGTFELRRRQDSGDKIARLVPYSSVYEVDAEQARDVEWGARDVEFRVTRAGALTLRVTDPGQAPVERYTVRLAPRNRNRWSSEDWRPRAQGEHPDGTVVLEGLTRGDWLLMVDFPAALGFDTLFESFTHEGGPRRMDLRAVPPSTRTLRVVSGDDAPVAGATVQLCDLFGEPFHDARLVMGREQWLWNMGSANALVLFETTTGADGRVELRGPGGRDLGLQVFGAGHVPVRTSGVRLDVTDELVVRVSRGARFTGRIVPPEAVAELRRLAGNAVSATFPENYRPRIELADAQGRRFPADHVTAGAMESLSIGDDGAFALDGVPPGTWKVSVRGWVAHGNGAGSRDFPAGEVVLADGKTTTRELDLAWVLPGTVDGLVLRNGKPYASGVVTLRGKSTWVNLQTDAEGRFRHTIASGEYTLMLQHATEGGESVRLHCPTPVRVVRGQTTTQTFAVMSTALRVTVLSSNGEPVAGARLHVLGSDEEGTWLRATGAKGVAEIELTTETVTLRILPKDLSTSEAQRKLWEEAQARGSTTDPLAPHWLALRTVALKAGDTTAVEVRLPADSGY